MKPASLFLATALLLATAPAEPDAAARTTVVDPSRGEVTFSVTKYGFERVNGRFNRFTASVVYDPAAPERSSIRWSVDVSSVETGEPNRDRSLQMPEYLDAARHPQLTFESRSVRPLKDGALEVTGTITIKGHAQPLTIVARRNAAGAFETDFTVNRRDFGVVGGSVLGRVISNGVRVHLVASA